MPIVCPACSKTNQSEDACQRCGCDLTRLHGIVEEAQSRLSAAVSAFAARDWPKARGHAERSWRLLHSPESAQLAFLAAAASRDTADASRWRTRAQNTPPVDP